MHILKTGHRGEHQGDTTSKRGSSLPNYLDQTQSSEFGQEEEEESHLGDDHGELQLLQHNYVHIYTYILVYSIYIYTA